MMQTQFADVLRFGKISLGEVVENLESRGWIEWRPNPAAKHARRVFPTKLAQSQSAHPGLRSYALRVAAAIDAIGDRSVLPVLLGLTP